MNTSLRDHPIFICGHPKSGTSLLRALLDGHPQLIVYPEETAFFRRYLPKIKTASLDEKLAVADRYLTHIFEWNTISPPSHQANYPDRDYQRFSATKIRQNMRRLIEERYRHNGDLLSAAILAFGSESGQLRDETRYWVEKTPYNEYFASQIFSWWEKARCIHIVRDPRDNFVSYRRKHPTWDPAQFANNWWKSTRIGLRNQQKYGKSRYLILTYEHFTRHLEESLNTILKFLDIRDDSTLRIPTRAGELWQGNSMFADKFTSVSPAAIGRWKTHLTQEEIAIIETSNHRLMRYFDYPLSKGNSKPPLKTRWRILKNKLYIILKEKNT